MTPLQRAVVVLLRVVVTLAPGACSSTGVGASPRLTIERTQGPDTLSRPEREAVWEAALRFYRGRRGATEADRSRRAHALVGIDSGAPEFTRAPNVLLGFRPAPLVAYDSTWLERVRAAHLVADVCLERQAVLCSDSTLTNYLDLGDPIPSKRGAVELIIWEVALNPLECNDDEKDSIIDMQEVSLELVRSSDDWVVDRFREVGHAFAFCSRRHDPG